MTLPKIAGHRPALGYAAVTWGFLALALGCAFVADLHIRALHPLADLARLGAGFLQPDLAVIGLRAAALTLAFAVVGVGLGATVGLALALVYDTSRLVRITAALLRSVHELFWAMLLLQITGISATTGVLALAIPYAGIFAKVFAEIMEEADLSAERALPIGSGTLSRFVFVRAPLLGDAFRAYLLYRLECGMRSTLILGFIGVPTIGFDLETYFSQGDYRQAAALILAFYALIATRGLWAQVKALPFLIAGSLAALALLTDGLAGDPVAVRLARFGHAIVPQPLRTGTGDLAGWLGTILTRQVWPGLVDTLLLSQLAATFAAILALILFPAISQRFSGPMRRGVGRGVLIVLRGTPEFVFAYVLLQMFGPSMLPAVLALGIHNGGIIGFLMGRHADRLIYRRDAPRGLDLYAYETVPRLYGQFMALVLYRYEIIVRESAILGILGVHTLGFYVNADIYEFRFDQACVVLGATALLSMTIDTVSRVLRRLLRIETLPVSHALAVGRSADPAATL